MKESAPNRVVVKFGGTDLSTGSKIRKAAIMIKQSCFYEVVVVVSAIANTTNSLINYMSEIGEIDDPDYCEVVAMGERISARIFSSTLNLLGLQSTYFEPQQTRWPIVTDSNFKNAKPDLEETRRRVNRELEPLLKCCIPVVCGFLGKNDCGFTTLLGRGGSDITATLLGNCLKADEIILVKETQGVLSADPNIVPDAKPIRRLTVEEMFSLAYGGAKIINHEALKYKLPEQRLQIVNFSSGAFSETATEITGVFESNSMEIRSHRGLTALTLIGDIDSNNLSKLFFALCTKEIYGISTGGSSVSIFAKIEDSKRTIRQIHGLKGFKAVSCRGNVGVIKLLNPEFIDSPGWIARISSALAEKGVNILEITTSKAAISVFVDEDKLKDALTCLRAN